MPSIVNTKRDTRRALIQAATWCKDAEQQIAEHNDRVDAMDSIRLARAELDKAEALIRESSPAMFPAKKGQTL